MTAIKNPDTLSEANFLKWYNNGHLEDARICFDSDVVLRFQNFDKGRPWQYLALYSLSDTSSVTAEAFEVINLTPYCCWSERFPHYKRLTHFLGKKISKTSPLLGGTCHGMHELHVELNLFRLVHQIVGSPSDERQTKAILTLNVDLPEDRENHVDNWFKEQTSSRYPLVLLIQHLQVAKLSFQQLNPSHAPFYIGFAILVWTFSIYALLPE